ncbi:hypothetical protein KHA80_07435 [Anaerobacillus sp. HL2]|nr:hypothetical protein KHA80_07435 [Anaerobacillus sp. HL2]
MQFKKRLRYWNAGTVLAERAAEIVDAEKFEEVLAKGETVIIFNLDLN